MTYATIFTTDIINMSTYSLYSVMIHALYYEEIIFTTDIINMSTYSLYSV